MDETDWKREFAEALVVLGLRKLVELGKVTPEEVNHRWYVKFDARRLENSKFAGGATLDESNRAVMVLPPEFTPESLMTLVAHEVVHLAQMCKGELIPMFGFQIWKGEEFLSLPANSPDYFTAQPWEKEADELQPILLEFLEKEVSKLR
jgi:hypothetical protein